jgi:hypothetical protein
MDSLECGACNKISIIVKTDVSCLNPSDKIDNMGQLNNLQVSPRLDR